MKPWFRTTQFERARGCVPLTGAAFIPLGSVSTKAPLVGYGVFFALRTSHFALRFWFLLYLVCAPLAVRAQRTFSLSIARDKSGVTVSWPAQSATPVGDLVLIPQYQVLRSADLKSWAPLGPTHTGTLHQVLSVTDSPPGNAFYRVQSIISQEYAQLSQAVLTGGDLQQADFFGATLFGAKLSQANLTGASFSGADLRSADLSEATASGADLFGVEAAGGTFDFVSLDHADAAFGDFEGASCFGTDLTGADLSFAILTSADLDFAVWKGVKLDAHTQIDPKPKLIWQLVNTPQTNAVLTNIDLSNATLADANFRQANFSRSSLLNSDLSRSDIRGANFNLANTSFIFLQGTLLDATTVIDSKSRLVWAILNQPTNGWDLHATNLSSVLLFGANLINANLTNAICTGSVFQTANLGNANLTRGSFNGAFFSGAILTNANLSLGQFQSADFTQANLFHANTNGANFTGATFSQTIMPDGSIR